MRKIVWLCSWYPNKLQPLLGDFIERHAIAASSLSDISVLHVTKMTDPSISRKCFSEKKTYNDNLRAEIIYCNRISSNNIFLRLKEQVAFFRQHIKWIRNYINENGKPDLIHVHVMLHNGLIAWYIKRRFGIPYLITEHWTGYLPEADKKFEHLNPFLKALYKKVVNGASSISVVSNYLGKSMKQLFGPNYTVIPNVVNTEIFYPPNAPAKNKFRFIHASGLDYQKNFEQIIEAVAILKTHSDQPFELMVYGPANAQLKKTIAEKRLEEIVFLKGEQPQDLLAANLRESDALILYSRFETFGCVVIEAQACGVPVIVSDINVMHEIVSPENGVFAKLDDPEDLAKQMRWLMDNKSGFDKTTIANATSARFAYPIVAAQFKKWYEEVLNKD